MGILEQMRSGTDSTFMQVVVAAVVVSFIGWYAQPQGDMSRTVAEVNGVKIMDTTYGRAYRNRLRQAEAEAQRTLSDAEQQQLGEMVKAQLVESEVILQEAQKLGLEVSQTEVAMEVLKIPVLLDENGLHDKQRYERFLKQQQYTQSAFEDEIRKDLLRQKLRFLAFMGASLSEPAMREAWEEQQTRVDVEYVAVYPTDFADEVEITDEERATFLAENEEQIRSTYDRDFSRLYNHPETVTLSMIRLGVVDGGPDRADLLSQINQLRDELEAGADFAELAARWSEDPSALRGGALDPRAVTQLNQEVVDALEGLSEGALTKAIPSDADVRLYRLEKRVEPYVESFDDVKNAIADQMLIAERAPALAARFADEELLPKWTEAGEAPRELIVGKGLRVRETGLVPLQGRTLPPAMLESARTIEPGSVMPQVFEQSGILYVGQLTERTEPDPAEFEEAREQLAEPMLGQRRVEFYQNWVADVTSRANVRR
jgi:peptidyl-prolyl cis-trans isomerase D